MRLKRLYIGDMGIYRNALMENIGSKIVVIGGLNRSGKTTLLEILRHMPYGFTKDLRETKTEYFVEGDFEDEQNQQYTVKLRGLREPQISSQAAKETALTNGIYGKVDKFTYTRLYTITLDELKKSNIKSEEEKLQSVLLGAGLKDIVHIPKLIEEFKREKEKVGGKHGNPNTKLFKPYYDKLLEGIDSREEALKQLEEYENKCEKLKELEHRIEACGKELNNVDEKVTALEVVKVYYNQYKERRALAVQLEDLKGINIKGFSEDFPSLGRIEALNEEYKEVLSQYEELKMDFETKVSLDIGVYCKLLQAKEQIRSFQKQLSGLKEKIESYKAMKEVSDRHKEQLQTKMNAINSSWRGDFLRIINMDCDSIEQDKLASLTDKLNVYEDDRKEDEREFEGLKLQREMLNREIRSLRTADLGMFIKKYLYISLGVLLAGALLFMFSKLLGGALALTGTVLASFYFITTYSGESQLQARKSALMLQLNILEDKLKLQEESITSKLACIDGLKKEISYYKNKLELHKEVSPMGLLQYFKEVKELKKDIINLGYSIKTIDRLQREINEDLIKANELVSSIIFNNLAEEKDLFKHSKELFIKLEELNENLTYAEKLSDCEARYYQTRNKIVTLLNIDANNVLLEEIDKIIEQYRIYNQCKLLIEKIDSIDRQLVQMLNSNRIMTAFKSIFEEYNIYEEKNILSILKLFESFSSYEQISREFDEINIKLMKASSKLEALKEEKQALSGEIKAISASEKLIVSQRVIDEQRAALKQLAVKYSVYSAAEFILDNVQKNFMDTAKDTILGGAGNIFNKITSGEYKALLPGDNLLQTDFKAMLYDGKVQESTSILSRGTGEQLYLSVRLNRIKEIKEKLPIILDDPFVNFDGLHIKNTLKVISDLAKDNQIFILTCHSALIRLINDISFDVQYWKLNKGRFNISNCEELTNYLL